MFGELVGKILVVLGAYAAIAITIEKAMELLIKPLITERIKEATKLDINRYVVIGISILVAVIGKLDFFTAIGVMLNWNLIFAYLISGTLISLGSNVLYQIIDKVEQVKPKNS
jgi:hypothetical protein